MTTLLVAEHDGTALKDVTAKALTAAVALGSDVHVLVAGSSVSGAAEAASRLAGVARVLVADSPALAHGLPEPLAELVLSIAEDYGTIMAPATATCKNAMPRVAAKLDVMQVSEITAVLALGTFERPIYAGNAIETVQVLGAKSVVTVRCSSFASAGEGSAVPILPVEAPAASVLSAFVGEELTRSDRPDLISAKVVVSGGRALGSAEKFQEFVVPLAERLGAAVGASRAAVDAGFASNDLQVGQTGKVVAPDLYVAIGISGAIQHLAGMKDSKIIVAINKDEDAPIFQIADYGLVGDLFEFVPDLTRALAD